MYETSVSYKSQSRLAAFCRNGSRDEIDNMDVRLNHVGHYRKLVFNVVSDSLSTAFPLTENFLPSDVWDNLINHFWENHKCQSPQIWKMPLEFLDYVKANHIALKQQYDFIEDLLLFEWLEVFYFLREDEVSAFKISENGTIQESLLVLNPESGIEVFNYPVFKIPAKEINPKNKATYLLCVHREPAEDRNVIFTELTPAFARMVQLLQEKPSTLSELVYQVCTELSIKANEHIYRKVEEFLTNALANKLILGYKD